MSPRFEPDFKKVRAGFPVYERGEYELEIDDVDGLSYTKDDGTEVAGVRINYRMVGRIEADGSLTREDEEEGWAEGDPVSSDRVYIHTDKAWPFTKRFLMAAAGYTMDEEDAFNEEFLSAHDFYVEGEGDDVEIGSGYEAVVGNHVVATLDTEMRDGDERQTVGSYQPVTS